MKLLVVRILPGEDLREQLAQLQRTQGFGAACIVSAAGGLSHAVLRFTDQVAGSELGGPLQLLSLSGTLEVDGPQLQATVGTDQGLVRGGQVMPGCVVGRTVEVVVGVLDGWEFRRDDGELMALRRDDEAN